MWLLLLFIPALVWSQAQPTVRAWSYAGTPTAGDCTTAKLGNIAIDTSTSPDNIYDCRESSGSAAWVLRTSGGGGSGTVTSVSITTANGVSGSVATATTTPAISLTLGAITPSSVTSPTLIGGTGTTSPLTYKSTSGVGTTGADHIFQVGNNGATEAMRILNNGQVGIGTISPGAFLHVKDTTNTQVTLQSSGVSSGFRLSNSTDSWVIRFVTNFNNGWFEMQDNTGIIKRRWESIDDLMHRDGIFGWSSETNFSTAGVGARDLGIKRNAAGVFEINNGTAGTFRDTLARSYRMNPNSDSKPTCSSTTRGTMWHTYGATSVKDDVQVCAKDAADAYAWRTIY